MQIQILCASLVLAVVTSAQVPVVISPVAAASNLGNSNNNIPFSWTPSAYQQVHSLNSFQVQVPALFTKLRMRMASGFTNQAGYQIDLELFLAQSPNSSTSAASTFASNVTSASEVNVFTRKFINLPQVPNNDWAVAPYVFDVPFFWPASDLSWRAIVWGNGNNNQIFTYPLDAFWHLSNGTSIGTGCTGTGSTSNAQHFTAIGAPGRSATFYGYSYFNAAIPAYLTLGTSSTQWGSIPLPFSLTSLNAPGCSLYNDAAAVLAGATTATGNVTFTFPVPNQLSLSGQAIYSQVVFTDPSLNGLGAITTNGYLSHVGTDPGMTRIYALGSPTATSGSLDIGFGMSVGFN